MSTFTIEKLQDEPILISTALSDWRAIDEMDPFIEEFMKYIETCGEPVYYIADLTLWNPNLTDIMVAANRAARSANAILHHPNVKKFVLVTSSRVVELAGNGLKSRTFGNVNIAVFPTLDAALAYARSS